MLEGTLQHKLTLCRDTILQILRTLSTNDKFEEIAVEFGTPDGPVLRVTMDSFIHVPPLPRNNTMKAQIWRWYTCT